MLGPKRTREKPTDKQGWLARTMSNVSTLAGALALALVIRVLLFEAFEIEGPSMEPTLLNGDRVVVAKYVYGLFLPFMNEAVLTWGLPNRGDVVIVRSPADNIDIVKRVIGVPGDTIEIRDDIVIRNGTPVPTRDLGACELEEGTPPRFPSDCHWFEERVGDEAYRVSRALSSEPTSYERMRVPEGSVYILGDHRDRSNDSRFLGPIPGDRIKGRALGIYWSSYHTFPDDSYRVRWSRFGSGID